MITTKIEAYKPHLLQLTHNLPGQRCWDVPTFQLAFSVSDSESFLRTSSRNTKAGCTLAATPNAPPGSARVNPWHVRDLFLQRVTHFVGQLFKISLGQVLSTFRTTQQKQPRAFGRFKSCLLYNEIELPRLSGRARVWLHVTNHHEL